MWRGVGGTGERGISISGGKEGPSKVRGSGDGQLGHRFPRKGILSRPPYLDVSVHDLALVQVLDALQDLLGVHSDHILLGGGGGEGGQAWG